MARMVCVWFPNWPLQRQRHERPELRGRPVVLFANTGNRGPRVAAWAPSETQRDNVEGITVGMPLAEAEALLAGHVGSAAHIELHVQANSRSPARSAAGSCGSM